MKLFYPDIFRDFYCIGSRCKDNCCKIGWDIEVDEDTYKFYQSLDDDLGKKITANIYEEDGCKYMGQDGGCPFLNENGLCSVLLTYGEDKISDICREHPRFYQWFGDYKEAGVGICCEKTVEMLIEHTEPIEFFTKDIDEEPDDLEFDENVLEVLLDIRSFFIGLIQNKGISLKNTFNVMRKSCYDLQESLDTGDLQNFLSAAENIKRSERVEELNCGSGYFKEILENLKEREYIHRDLPELLNYTLENWDKVWSISLPDDHNYIFRHLAVYFTYRYLINAVRSFDIYSEFTFIFESITDIYFLLAGRYLQKGSLNKDDLIFVIKEYSKEVEYSE